MGLVDSSHPSAEEVLHLTTEHLQVTTEDNFWSTVLELQNSAQVLPGMCMCTAFSVLLCCK